MRKRNDAEVFAVGYEEGGLEDDWPVISSHAIAFSLSAFDKVMPILATRSPPSRRVTPQDLSCLHA